jgi:hypothetical protein
MLDMHGAQRELGDQAFALYPTPASDIPRLLGIHARAAVRIEAVQRAD